MNDYSQQLPNLDLLRRAWHLARDDSRTDFMFDPYRYSDFGFLLDDYLRGISQSLASQAYHPRPLLTIDVPKSSLAVRPGSVLAIEDKIVLFAITCLIAPPMDKKLPPNVYSWRVKSGSKKIFQDHEVLRFPFLKHRTIQKHIEFIEPWYGVWPSFIREVEVAYQNEGYQFMVISDIVAYFENIDLGLLRDLLLQHLPQQSKIIHFLIRLLEYWAWPAVYGSSVPRGIPQGNGVSSFLGNIYLLSLDKAFVSFEKRKDIKYVRYMDDVKILTKDMATAREALFLMNDKLRELRLNIQGSKTHILQGNEIREDLFDDRLERINEIIEEVKESSSLTTEERKQKASYLKLDLNRVKGKKGIVRGKELRLFRRLITGFTLLRDSGMIRQVLDQLHRNPDERLLNSSVRYLRVMDRNRAQIASELTRLLTQSSGLFPYQQAHFFMTLKYVRKIPRDAWKKARRVVKLINAHWYVRQQAATLLGLKKLSKRELKTIRTLFGEERNLEVKRAWCQALAQLPENELKEITQTLIFSTEPVLQRLGRFYYGLLFKESEGIKQIKSIFDQAREDIFIDRLYEIEVLSKAKSGKVRKVLLAALKNHINNIHRPQVKERIERLKNTLATTVKIMPSK